MATDTRLDVLNNLRIASPCPMQWEDMDGESERVRHCRECDLYVYNLASIRGEEILDLIEGTEGRVCGVLYRRADGTIITSDCPRGVEILRRSVWRAKAIAVALALFIPACVAWASSRQRNATLADAGPFKMIALAISSPPPAPLPPRRPAFRGATRLAGAVAAPRMRTVATPDSCERGS
ncbi:MAG: hypothetical protein ACF8QF_09390 [Phycisphaerales bacterium]